MSLLKFSNDEVNKALLEIGERVYGSGISTESTKLSEDVTLNIKTGGSFSISKSHSNYELYKLMSEHGLIIGRDSQEFFLIDSLTEHSKEKLSYLRMREDHVETYCLFLLGMVLSVLIPLLFK